MLFFLIKNVFYFIFNFKLIWAFLIIRHKKF